MASTFTNRPVVSRKLKVIDLVSKYLSSKLNATSVKDLMVLAEESGMDPCGENGEYHTMVIDGPIFKEAIEVSKFSKEKHDNRLYIKISEFSLKPKNAPMK